MDAKEILLPLIAGIGSAVNPHAGGAIRGALGGYLAVQQEKRAEKKDAEDNYWRSQRAMQEERELGLRERALREDIEREAKQFADREARRQMYEDMLEKTRKEIDAAEAASMGPEINRHKLPKLSQRQLVLKEVLPFFAAMGPDEGAPALARFIADLQNQEQEQILAEKKAAEAAVNRQHALELEKQETRRRELEHEARMRDYEEKSARNQTRALRNQHQIYRDIYKVQQDIANGVHGAEERLAQLRGELAASNQALGAAPSVSADEWLRTNAEIVSRYLRTGRSSTIGRGAPEGGVVVRGSSR